MFKIVTFERSFRLFENDGVQVLRIFFQKFEDALHIFEADVFQRSLQRKRQVSILKIFQTMSKLLIDPE